jgi:hypothetical protein
MPKTTTRQKPKDYPQVGVRLTDRHKAILSRLEGEWLETPAGVLRRLLVEEADRRGWHGVTARG